MASRKKLFKCMYLVDQRLYNRLVGNTTSNLEPIDNKVSTREYITSNGSNTTFNVAGPALNTSLDPSDSPDTSQDQEFYQNLKPSGQEPLVSAPSLPVQDPIEDEKEMDIEVGTEERLKVNRDQALIKKYKSQFARNLDALEKQEVSHNISKKVRFAGKEINDQLEQAKKIENIQLPLDRSNLVEKVGQNERRQEVLDKWKLHKALNQKKKENNHINIKRKKEEKDNTIEKDFDSLMGKWEEQNKIENTDKYKDKLMYLNSLKSKIKDLGINIKQMKTQHKKKIKIKEKRSKKLINWKKNLDLKRKENNASKRKDRVSQINDNKMETEKLQDKSIAENLQDESVTMEDVVDTIPENVAYEQPSKADKYESVTIKHRPLKAVEYDQKMEIDHTERPALSYRPPKGISYKSPKTVTYRGSRPMIEELRGSNSRHQDSGPYPLINLFDTIDSQTSKFNPLSSYQITNPLSIELHDAKLLEQIRNSDEYTDQLSLTNDSRLPIENEERRAITLEGNTERNVEKYTPKPVDLVRYQDLS